jgi:aminoglycoside phosphotransferase (APT) family kinase protein
MAQSGRQPSPQSSIGNCPTLGHPLADLAYFCMALRLPRNPVLPGLAGMDRADLGIPKEAAMIERFAARDESGPAAAVEFPARVRLLPSCRDRTGCAQARNAGQRFQRAGAGRRTHGQAIAELGASAAH